MKKNLLTFVLCASGLFMANAQTVSSESAMNLQPVKMTQARTVVEATNPASFVFGADQWKNVLAKQNRRADALATAEYGFPKGSLFWGYDSEFRGYSVILMQTPSLTDVVFPNYSYAADSTIVPTYKWTYGGSEEVMEMDQTEDGDGIMNIWGFYNFPELTAYVNGDSVSSYTILSKNDNPAYVQGYMDAFQSLTNANPGLNAISGYSGAGGYETGALFFNTEKKCVGLIQTYDKPLDVVYTDSMFVHGWFTDPSNEQGNLPEGTTPATIFGDNVLTATICTVGADGSLVEYAKATCNKESVTFDATYGSCVLQFAFTSEDPLFGTVSSPINLPNEEFMVIITGFENMAYNYLTMMTAVGQLGIRGHSFALLEDGSMATIGYSNYPDIPQSDLFVSFNSFMPMAVTMESSESVTVYDQLVVPVEGGTAATYKADGEEWADFDIYTMSPIDEWSDPVFDEGTEGWITVKTDNSLFEQYNVVMFVFEGDALPDGITGRGGYVTLSLYGKTIAVPVKQGDFVIDGIEAPKADIVLPAKYAGKTFNISGQEMMNKARGLMIRDGKKFLVK